ncbi:hypothetical protein DAMA08_016960 [Martiniozyma asiatica (nom. inval.)]|nr:hypothetical protein DAMA08_016960 [Martiniozyma asiatica]
MTEDTPHLQTIRTYIEINYHPLMTVGEVSTFLQDLGINPEPTIIAAEIENYKPKSYIQQTYSSRQKDVKPSLESVLATLNLLHLRLSHNFELSQFRDKFTNLQLPDDTARHTENGNSIPPNTPYCKLTRDVRRQYEPKMKSLVDQKYTEFMNQRKRLVKWKINRGVKFKRRHKHK